MSSAFRDLAGKTLDESAEKVIQSLLAVVQDSGKVTKRATCTKCGNRDEVELETVDAKTMLEVARFLSEQGFGRTGTTAAPANDATIKAVQQDLDSLSDGELLLLVAQASEGETLRERVDRLRTSIENDSKMLNDFQAIIDELRSKPVTVPS